MSGPTLNPPPKHKARGSAVGILIALLTCLPTLKAQQLESPTTRPLLNELNLETQELFKQIAPSIVRVQMPFPSNIAQPPDETLLKWADRLDPQSLARLAELQRRSPGITFATAEIRPTTIPSGAQPTVGRRVIILRLDRFSPNAIGIVFDDKNDLLIPRYVDAAACVAPIPVAIGDGRYATASFVASDRETGLTILKLHGLKLKPAVISTDKIGSGALLLVISLNPASNRLAVWEGWEPDFSALVNTDGTVAGFTRAGRYLSAGACSPVVTELMEHGVVRRALLGVVIKSVAADDPEREKYPALGATPALRIAHIIPGSPAERAGLQEDDLVLSLAGQTVGDAPAFAAAIANRRGQTDIAILRDGQRHEVNVYLQVQ
ncbi:MAG TPA: S1C family serine protease [Tepidisphaeraceae bacterium]|jgi:S1-C subfamily serine protease